MVSFDEIKDICDPVSAQCQVKKWLGWGRGIQLFPDRVSLCYEALWMFSNGTDG